MVHRLFARARAFDEDPQILPRRLLPDEFAQGLRPQGGVGILGGALTAIAPDFTRAALGVPAMNYSVLLPRSVLDAPKIVESWI